MLRYEHLVDENMTEKERIEVFQSWLADEEDIHWSPALIKKYIDLGADAITGDEELRDIFATGIARFIETEQ